jgi:hypothetical protein
VHDTRLLLLTIRTALPGVFPRRCDVARRHFLFRLHLRSTVFHRARLFNFSRHGVDQTVFPRGRVATPFEFFRRVPIRVSVVRSIVRTARSRDFARVPLCWILSAFVERTPTRFVFDPFCLFATLDALGFAAPFGERELTTIFHDALFVLAVDGHERSTIFPVIDGHAPDLARALGCGDVVLLLAERRAAHLPFWEFTRGPLRFRVRLFDPIADAILGYRRTLTRTPLDEIITLGCVPVVRGLVPALEPVFACLDGYVSPGFVLRTRVGSIRIFLHTPFVTQHLGPDVAIFDFDPRVATPSNHDAIRALAFTRGRLRKGARSRPLGRFEEEG